MMEESRLSRSIRWLLGSHARTSAPLNAAIYDRLSRGVRWLLGYDSQYAALNNAAKEIRLVRLLPPGPEGIICCELEHFELDAAPEYRAVSYHWSRGKIDREIVVNGSRIQIPYNVYAYLEMISAPSSYHAHWKESPLAEAGENRVEQRYFWIDQLCIDQGNIVEKSRQVQLMGDIYRGASATDVWLGTDEKLSIVGLVGNTRDNPQGRRDFVISVVLFDNPYWQRLWIVQEVLLSRHLVVRCGKYQIPWIEVEKLSTFFTPLGRLGFSFGQGRGTIVVDTRRKWLEQQPSAAPADGRSTELFERDASTPAPGRGGFSLLEALRLFMSHDCFDVRDKVFGIMGLVREDQQLVVDYSLSRFQVFSRVAAAVKKFEGINCTEDYDLAALGLMLLGDVEEHKETIENLRSRAPRKS